MTGDAQLPSVRHRAGALAAAKGRCFRCGNRAGALGAVEGSCFGLAKGPDPFSNVLMTVVIDLGKGQVLSVREKVGRCGCRKC